MNSGDRLKSERARLGLNQGDLAALAGVSKTTQFNYEKGDRSPDAEYLAAVANAGVDVMYVITGQRGTLSPESLTSEEATLLENYRKSSISDRAFLQRLGVLASDHAGR